MFVYRQQETNTSFLLVSLSGRLGEEGLSIYSSNTTYIKMKVGVPMAIGNFINLLLIFTIFFGLRYFFEPNVKEQGI
jgi:hypothetical protein